MATSNSAHIPEENKLRILLESIADGLSAKYGDEFYAIKSLLTKINCPMDLTKKRTAFWQKTNPEKRRLFLESTGSA